MTIIYITLIKMNLYITDGVTMSIQTGEKGGGEILHSGLCDLSLHQGHRQPRLQPAGGAGWAVC